MSTDTDRAHLIRRAMVRGWHPAPDHARGVELADLLAQGDPYGTAWRPPTPTAAEPGAAPADRHLSPADAPHLAAAADAATTWLSSSPPPEDAQR